MKPRPEMELSHGDHSGGRHALPAILVADGADTGRLRRCLVTREVLPKSTLMRFAIGPDAMIVPDLAARLPGRGLWVKARRDVLARAVAKRLFAKAAKQPVEVPADLLERTCTLLAQRCLQLIGLARGAGQAVTGFERVREWLLAGRAGLLLVASDGAVDGRRKLALLAKEIPILDLFSAAELSAALGRGNVVYAALAKGGLAMRLDVETGRLSGLRGID